MNRVDRARALLLMVGAAATSALNFYAFVLLPTVFGAAALDRFVRDNYYGGLYMAMVGGSIAPVTIYILQQGRRPALVSYAGIAAAVWLLQMLTWAIWGDSYWGAVCLTTAILMQISGFSLASVLDGQRIKTAVALQLSQPMMFALLLTLDVVVSHGGHRWALWHVMSAAVSLCFFVRYTDWRKVRSMLKSNGSVSPQWRELAARIVACVSFAFFFQLELILVGEFSSVDLGTYAIYQKLYASVSISIFGALSLWMLARKNLANEVALTRWLLGISFVGFVAVLFVGTLVDFLDRDHYLSVDLLVLTATVAALFTACAFICLLLQHRRPYDVLTILCASLGLYSAMFTLIQPGHIGAMLWLCAMFFLSFLAMAMTAYLRRGNDF